MHMFLHASLCALQISHLGGFATANRKIGLTMKDLPDLVKQRNLF
jgi:hypothetical protein